MIPPADASAAPTSNSKLFLYAFSSFTLVSTVLLAPFLVTPALPRRLYGALPYQHTPASQITKAMSLLRARLAARSPPPPLSSLSFVDLGSGLGEATIAAGRLGFGRSHGVEINPTLLLLSRLSSIKAGFSPWTKQVSFRAKNLLTLPLDKYDCVFMFGVKPLLKTMKPKLTSELRPGSLLLLYRFKLETDMVEGGRFQVVGKEGELTLYERTKTNT